MTHFVGKQIVNSLFQKQKLLIFLGAKITNIQKGTVTIELPKTQDSLQHHGFFHGGIVSTLGDVCAGLAACSLFTHHSHSALTVEFKINFLRPASGQKLIGVGNIIKENKQLIITSGQIYSDQKMCAYLTQTIKRLIPQNNKKQE